MSAAQWTHPDVLHRPMRLVLSDYEARLFNELLLAHEHDLIDLRHAVYRANDSGDYSTVKTILDTALQLLQAAQTLMETPVAA